MYDIAKLWIVLQKKNFSGKIQIAPDTKSICFRGVIDVPQNINSLETLQDLGEIVIVVYDL